MCTRVMKRGFLVLWTIRGINAINRTLCYLLSDLVIVRGMSEPYRPSHFWLGHNWLAAGAVSGKALYPDAEAGDDD
jgi:hypothetical protein